MNNPATAPQSTRPHFVLCRADKTPERRAWQREPATAQEALAHKAAGGLVGLIPGSLDHAVIDIDEGEPAAAIAALGEPAFRNRTPSGGTHLWYPVARGRSPVRNGKWKLDGAAGDIRGDKGFVVLWAAGTVAALEDAAMFAAPLDMARLDAMRASGKADPDADTWPEGERNESFNRAVHAAARRGDTAGVAAAVAKARESGLPEGEIRATLASGIAAGARDYSPPVTADDFEDAPEDAESDGLGFRPASALYEPKEPLQWLVAGLLALGGLSLWYGRPKVGKSTLLRFLAYCVARGVPFLGRDVTAGPVLFVAMQDLVAAFDAEMVKLGIEEGDPFHSAVIWSAPQDALSRLRQDMERLQPALVVIDMLGTFLPGTEWNDYGKAVAALRPFMELAGGLGAHIAFLHHSNKSDNEDMGARSLGSTGLEGEVHALIELTRGQGGAGRYVEARGRGVDFDKAEVSFCPATGHFELGGTVEDTRLQEARDAILTALEDGPLNARDLRTRARPMTDCRDSVLDQARHSLVMSGKIRQSSGPRNSKIFESIEKVTADDF